MKVIGYSGMPATGKSTLMKAFMKKVGMFWTSAKVGLVVYSEYASKKLIVLGDYSQDDLFAGTDKLSMAVQPAAERLLTKWSKEKSDWTVVFEGDRLFNGSFLTFLQKLPKTKPHFVLLQVHEETLANRHRERQDTQTDQWLAGRQTKLRNIADTLGSKLEVWSHEDAKHTQENVGKLLELCKRERSR
jgi:hypothetical protein